MDLSSHTLSQTADGRLIVVPLDPSKIKTKPKVEKPQEETQEQAVIPASVTLAETAPALNADVGMSLTGSADASGSAGGAINGSADTAVPSIQIEGAVASPDANVQLRKKQKKSFSLAGFGKKHKSVADTEQGKQPSKERKSRSAKTRSMPGFGKKHSGIAPITSSRCP